MYRGCQVKADLLSFPNLLYAYNGVNGSLLQVAGNWNGTVLQYPTYNHRSQATNECVERVFFTDSGTLPVIRDQRGFTYDPRGSLTAETGTTAGTWALDPARNWTTTNQNGATETRTSTGGDNEYNSITAGGTARAITYDLNGNVTGYTEPDGAATNAYTYDWNNRLTSATRTTGGVATVTTWTYDAFNRRAVETTAVNNGSYIITTSTWFVFNGSRVIEEYAAASGGSPVNVHLYRPGTNELLFTVQASSGRRFFYFQDSRGSVLAAGINFMGYDNYFCLAEQYRYSAYGKQTMLNGANTAITSSLFNNRFGYTGQWSSPALKLAHFPNRDYNPLLGRFLQRDPAGLLDGPNRYAYCHNDPVNCTDPDGRISLPNGAFNSGNRSGSGFYSWDTGNTNNQRLSNAEKVELNAAIAYDNSFEGTMHYANTIASANRTIANFDFAQNNMMTRDQYADSGAFQQVYAAAEQRQAIREELSSGFNMFNPVAGLKLAKMDFDDGHYVSAGIGAVLSIASIIPGEGELSMAAGAELRMASTAGRAVSTGERLAINAEKSILAPGKVRFLVTESGVAIPTEATELKTGLQSLQETSTAPATAKKFVGADSQGPMRVRVEKAHPSDPNFTGTPDPLHTVDHLHIDRRSNGATGSWESAEKVPYEWPF